MRAPSRKLLGRIFGWYYYYLAAISIVVVASQYYANAFVVWPSFAFQKKAFVVRRQEDSRAARLELSYTTSSATTSSTTENKLKNPWTSHDRDLLHRNFSPKKFIISESGDEDSAATVVDYVVIGSGIGGLWLAACLAKFNYTVLVLEQHYTAGGLQHTFQVTSKKKHIAGDNNTTTTNTYEFIPGLHYIANLQLCGPLYDLVATNISAATDGDVPELRYLRAGDAVPADQHALCSHDLQVGSLPRLQVKEGLDAVRAELRSVFPDETHGIDEFLKIMEAAKWQAGQFATFKIFPRWLQFLLSQFICSNYIHYASRTTEEVLEGITTDGRLKTVLSAFGGDLGESLSDGSFSMQAAVLGHVLEGCYYPESGPIQFVRGLVPTIRQVPGGDVLVNARVQQIVIENGRAVGVKVANPHHGEEDVTIRAKRGVVSDAGIKSTLDHLLPPELVHAKNAPLRRLYESIEASSGGISHVFMFVGLNASSEELNLRSSSFYYIPWNETDKSMDATAIQDFYRDTLLDPNVSDVSAGMVFCTAKDPDYSATTMPGKSTVIVFSEARAEDFQVFMSNESDSAGKKHTIRPAEYKEAKQLIERKMMNSLLTNFPQLTPYVDVVEVGTPLTLLDYTLRTETLGLRHTPRRMTDMEIRPDCAIPGLYFTGQDVSFAGWAGALSGAMVTVQRLLGYTLLDFARGKTLMRDLGGGDIEDMIQSRVQEATKASPMEVAAEIFGNAVRHVRQGRR